MREVTPATDHDRPAGSGSDDLPTDETALIERARRGETAAFDALVTLHRQKVYATIYNATRNEEDAWDLSQETFLKAWKSLHLFRGQSSFFTWLYRIATNVSIDWLRRKKIQSGTPFDDTILPESFEPGSHTAPRREATPRRQIENREIRRRIEAAIETLSPEHRMVITLRELEGESYEAIAEAVGCSLGTVMSRLFYARKKLQLALKDLYETV
ncbi:MAG TPA: sigma-70 family RNA polymerase sigma factor [Chthoniobacteraceae bacterium]|nr:sigma-70 family RNA polymerase sigma factor [Chthoniobacteraceae bacterium]